MNHVEKLHLNAVEDAEYEEIKNSAIYKMDFEEAAVSCANITERIAIKFNQWVTRSMYDFVRSNTWKHLVSGKEITGNELYEQFLKTIE